MARYIAELSAQLAVLARRNRLDFAAYLLDMAVIEADEQARQRDGEIEEDPPARRRPART